MELNKNLSLLNNKLLLLLLSVTTLFFTVAGYYWGERLMLLEAQNDARSSAISSGDFVVSEIARFELLPNMAQMCDCLKDLLNQPDDENLKDKVNRNLEKIATMSEAQVVYLMSTDGKTLASSNWKSKKSFVGKNYGIRPYFKDAMNLQKGRYVALGLTSNKLGYYLANSVLEEEDVRGALVVKIGIDELREKIATQFEKRDEDILIAEKHDVVFLSTEPAWLFKALSPLSTQELENIAKHKTFAGRQVVPLQLDNNKYLSKSASLLSHAGVHQYLMYRNDLHTLQLSVNAVVPLYKYFGIRRLSLFSGLILGLLISSLISLFFIRERYQKKILENAIKDPLTGLYTRLYLQEAGPKLFSLHQRDPSLEIAVVLLDLDHFKKVNDTFGHATGDKVLAMTGELINEVIRSGDIAVRYGGEEVLLILPCIDADVVERLLERIRVNTSKLKVECDEQEVGVTISGGVVLAAENESMIEAINRADEKLYKAKHAGRDQIIF